MMFRPISTKPIGFTKTSFSGWRENVDLLGGFNHLEKYEFGSWDYYSQYTLWNPSGK
jgi:hypothetical protein